MKQSQASLKELTQINTLIAALTRSVELLNVDIDFEERRANVRDLSDPAYTILARQLRRRRDNLKETITALKARLPSEQPLETRYAESLTG
jgi:hypothetical protein